MRNSGMASSISSFLGVLLLKLPPARARFQDTGGVDGLGIGIGVGMQTLMDEFKRIEKLLGVFRQLKPLHATLYCMRWQPGVNKESG